MKIIENFKFYKYDKNKKCKNPKLLTYQKTEKP